MDVTKALISSFSLGMEVEIPSHLQQLSIIFFCIWRLTYLRMFAYDRVCQAPVFLLSGDGASLYVWEVPNEEWRTGYAMHKEVKTCGESIVRS